MSEGNGIIRIGRKGKKKFALGEGPEVEIDVVEAHNDWRRTDSEFRVNGEVPIERDEEYQQSAQRFARNWLQAEDITYGEAWEFITIIASEVEALNDFFRKRSPAKQESPQPSTTVVTLP